MYMCVHTHTNTYTIRNVCIIIHKALLNFIFLVLRKLNSQKTLLFFLHYIYYLLSARIQICTWAHTKLSESILFVSYIYSTTNMLRSVVISDLRLFSPVWESLSLNYSNWWPFYYGKMKSKGQTPRRFEFGKIVVTALLLNLAFDQTYTQG